MRESSPAGSRVWIETRRWSGNSTTSGWPSPCSHSAFASSRLKGINLMSMELLVATRPRENRNSEGHRAVLALVCRCFLGGRAKSSARTIGLRCGAVTRRSEPRPFAEPRRSGRGGRYVGTGQSGFAASMGPRRRCRGIGIVSNIDRTRLRLGDREITKPPSGGAFGASRRTRFGDCKTIDALYRVFPASDRARKFIARNSNQGQMTIGRRRMRTAYPFFIFFARAQSLCYSMVRMA